MKRKFYLIIMSCLVSSLFISNLDAFELSQNEKRTVSIFKQTANSVVNITNYKRVRRGAFFFSDMDETAVPAGTGSGYVWSKDGYIVTNYHVVDNGVKFFVTFNNDKKQYEAKLVGRAPQKDIAVLKLVNTSRKLIPIIKGSSTGLMVGQDAYAIGNPFGLDHTITKGIVSALGRKIPGFGGVKIYGMIQTDCSINPGNSGGPLLNSAGELIGMNTMIFSSTGSNAGIGFAVPVDTIKKIVPQLIKNGKVSRPALGVALLGDDVKSYLGITRGVVIGDVKRGGAADKAGLQGVKRDRYGRFYLGDILLSIEGNSINNYDDIYHALDKFKIGSTVKIKYKRNDKIKFVKLKLEKLSH